jgi:hypothetical protein
MHEHQQLERLGGLPKELQCNIVRMLDSMLAGRRQAQSPRRERAFNQGAMGFSRDGGKQFRPDRRVDCRALIFEWIQCHRQPKIQNIVPSITDDR